MPMQTPALTGQRFGRVVVEVMDVYQGKASTLCQCDGGNTKSARAYDLRRGFIQSCGCWQKEHMAARRRKDLTGQRFGRLVVEAMEWWNEVGYAFCRCECGETARVTGAHLLSGHTQSCGCLFQEIKEQNGRAKRKDLTGMQFGRLLVIAMEWVNGNGQAVCQCVCGRTGLRMRANELTQGHRKSCGCIRYRTAEEKYAAQKLKAHIRLARTRGLPHTFKTSDEVFLRTYWGDACAICGATADFWHRIAWDHWIPLANPTCPGTVPDNILPLCHGRKGAGTLSGPPACNCSKYHRDPTVWLTERLGVRKAKAKLREIAAYFTAVRERAVVAA